MTQSVGAPGESNREVTGAQALDRLVCTGKVCTVSGNWLRPGKDTLSRVSKMSSEIKWLATEKPRASDGRIH